MRPEILFSNKLPSDADDAGHKPHFEQQSSRKGVEGLSQYGKSRAGDKGTGKTVTAWCFIRYKK